MRQVRHSLRAIAVGLTLTVVLTVHRTAIAAEIGPACRERLQSAIGAAVARHLGLSNEQVQITVHTIRLDADCSEAEKVDVDIPTYADVVGPTTVRVTLANQAGTIAVLSVPVRVDLYADVLVTARPLSRHAMIRPQDLTRERRPITDVSKWVMCDADSVVGRWADRTINPGRIVDRRWVVEIPVVRRGASVMIAYTTGAVRVARSAVAMEDGYRGQKIRVKPQSGGRWLTVSVIDGNTVCPVP
ncbi:MAG: flagellar basal body P-ring formation chaperone FlgA [Candidatus Zixiibacteriota bacterium]